MEIIIDTPRHFLRWDWETRIQANEVAGLEIKNRQRRDPGGVDKYIVNVAILKATHLRRGWVTEHFPNYLAPMDVPFFPLACSVPDRLHRWGHSQLRCKLSRGISRQETPSLVTYQGLTESRGQHLFFLSSYSCGEHADLKCKID